MKENKLTIKINKPVAEVFDFTINPANTPKWIDFIAEERVSGGEIKQGVRYVNVDTHGRMAMYDVATFDENKIFELQSVPPRYVVRYTYRQISDSECELEYHEWVDAGELENPFELKHLEKLKQILEQN